VGRQQPERAAVTWRGKVQESVQLCSQPVQPVALIRERRLSCLKSGSGAVRSQGILHCFGRPQLGYSAKERVHRAVRDQLGAAAVRAHHWTVRDGAVVQGGRSVVGDQCVCGDQDRGPLLVWSGEDHPRVERRSQHLGQLERPEPTVLVGMHHQGQLVLVVGQMSGEPGRQVRALPQDGLVSPGRDEREQCAGAGLERCPVSITQRARGEGAVQSGVTDHLRPAGSTCVAGGEPGQLARVGEGVQGYGSIAVSQEQRRVESGRGVGALCRDRLVVSGAVRQQHVPTAEQGKVALRARREHQVVGGRAGFVPRNRPAADGLDGGEGVDPEIGAGHQCEQTSDPVIAGEGGHDIEQAVQGHRRPRGKQHSPSPVARRPSPVARRPSPVARRPSPVARRPSPVAQLSIVDGEFGESMVFSLVGVGSDVVSGDMARWYRS